MGTMLPCNITCPFCSHEFETEFNWMIEDVDCPGCKKTIDMEVDGGTETGFYMTPSAENYTELEL